MNQPKPAYGDISYALEKFGEDARLWSESAHVLKSAKDSAADLTIAPLAFGPAVWMGLSERYNEIQQMIIERLDEGSVELERISRALIRSRNDYRDDEDSGVHEMNRVW